jgi:hypothetical protein
MVGYTSRFPLYHLSRVDYVLRFPPFYLSSIKGELRFANPSYLTFC